jgi:hypothetical protein
MTRDEIINKLIIYLSTIPAGAGGSFLGYLQQLYLGEKNKNYMGKVNYKKEDEFPFNSHNKWDVVDGCGHNVYGYFPKIKVRAGIYREPSNTVRNYSYKPNIIDSNHWDFPGSELQKECMDGLLTQIMAEQTYSTTIKGHMGIWLHLHEYPTGIQVYFRNIKHILTIQMGDLDTQIYCYRLKKIKDNDSRKSNIIEYSKKLLENEIKSNKNYPAETILDYKKIFFDYDINEIKRYFYITCGEQKHFNFDSIINMIKIYTKRNKELLND